MDKYFPIVTLDSCSFVEFDTFITFLKTNHLKSDHKQEIRRSNVQRLLKGYRGGLKEYDGKQYIPIESVMRYVFYQIEELEICNCIAQTALQKLFDSRMIDRTILDLYNTVAHDEKLFPLSDHLSICDIEHKINTVFLEYKSKFSLVQWNKILIFEWHFMRGTGKEHLESNLYENNVALKWDFYNKL